MSGQTNMSTSVPLPDVLLNAQRIVIKVGSALVVDKPSGGANGEWMAGLARDIAALTATGKARCADKKCWQTQAILDLQKAPPNSVKFGNIVLNSNNLISTLTARWNEQKNCELRGGTGDTNCTAEQHQLTFKSSAPGACDTIFTFDAKSTTGGTLKNANQLKNKLMFVGYPSNPYLAFSSTGTTVSIDPTFGLNEGSNTSAGSCQAVCTKISATSVAGACCSCNGKSGKFAKSPWSATTFQCL